MKSSTDTHHRTYKTNKFERPFSPKHAMHFILKSSIARGEYSLALPQHSHWIREYLPTLAGKMKIKLFHWANSGSHLHLVLRAKTRSDLNCFIRTLSSQIVRKVLRAEKGRPKGIKFWSHRPYSRVLTWRREFNNVIRYVERNVLEAAKKISYISRDRKKDIKATQEEIERSLFLKRAGPRQLCFSFLK